MPKKAIGLAVVIFILLVGFAINNTTVKCGNGMCERWERNWGICRQDCPNQTTDTKGNNTNQEGDSAGEPQNYQALYTELETSINAFDVQLTKDNASNQPIFAAELLSANSNRGQNLLKSTAIIGVQYELDRLKALNVQGVVIAVNFPLFYAPYHADQATFDAYINFYKQVVEQARIRSMTVIIESGPIFTKGGFSTLDVQDYYNSLSEQDYLKARADTAATVAQTLHPDYLTVSVEPDTEATQSGKSINNPDFTVAIINQTLQNMQSAQVENVKIGAGIGTWHPQYQKFINAIGQTQVDYIDMHIYPVNRDFLDRAATIVQLASQYNKPVSISEAWLYKAQDNELGKIDVTTFFARDAFSFWAPLDQTFLETLTKFARQEGLIFMSPFWTKYFYAYLDYNEYGNLEAQSLISASASQAAQAILDSNYTQTGLKYQELINNE